MKPTKPEEKKKESASVSRARPAENFSMPDLMSKGRTALEAFKIAAGTAGPVTALKLMPYWGAHGPAVRICVQCEGTITPERRQSIKGIVASSFANVRTDTVTIRKKPKFREADISLYGYRHEHARIPLHRGITING